MSRLRRPRFVLLAALVVGLGLVSTVPGRTIATGAPIGASPLVYVTANAGEVDAFTLSAIAAGGTSTPTQTNALSGDGELSGVAISADSSTAVVLGNEDGSEDLGTIDTTTGVAIGPFGTLPGNEGTLVAVGADPANSAVAYVLTAFGFLYQVDLGTQTVTEVADIASTLTAESSPFDLEQAHSLAIAADGKTAYVGAFGVFQDVDGEAVMELPLGTTNPPVAVWAQRSPTFAERIGVSGLALTPTGNEIFGCDRGEVFGLQLPISATETPFDVVPLPGVDSVTVGPHGKNLYAGVINANAQASVIGFPLTAPGNITTDSLQTVTGFPLADANAGIRLAEAPSGATLLATVTLESDAGVPTPFLFAVSLGNVTAAGDPVMNLQPALSLPSNLLYPVGMAITPDQAPHAHLTVSPALAGSASGFDAATSTVKYGAVTSYRWNFGDGTPVATTSSDTETHVYTSAGTYTVTLVETDAVGTSIPPAFSGTPTSWVANGPGQTPYRLSSTLAETSQSLTIVGKHHKKPPPPPPPPKHPKKRPRLMLQPTVGPPGSVVTVTGVDFPNNASVTVEWSTPNASGTAVTVKAHGGRFVTQLLVLVPDLLGQRRAIALTFTKANRPTFLVVASSEEPGGPDSDPVFRSEGP